MRPYQLIFAAAFLTVSGCSKIKTAFDVDPTSTTVETYQTVVITPSTSNEAKQYTADWDHVGVETFDGLPATFHHYYPDAGLFHVKITANCEDDGMHACEYSTFTRTVEVTVVPRAKKYEGTFSAQTTVELSACGGSDTVLNTTAQMTYQSGEQLHLSNLFGLGDVHGFVVNYPPLENPTETNSLSLDDLVINNVTLNAVAASVAPPANQHQINDIQISGQYSVQGNGCLVNFTSNLQRR
jgi:hypothetical protein